jgi:hypothetical protein
MSVSLWGLGLLFHPVTVFLTSFLNCASLTLKKPSIHRRAVQGFVAALIFNRCGPLVAPRSAFHALARKDGSLCWVDLSSCNNKAPEKGLVLLDQPVVANWSL